MMRWGRQKEGSPAADGWKAFNQFNESTIQPFNHSASSINSTNSSQSPTQPAIRLLPVRVSLSSRLEKEKEKEKEKEQEKELMN